MIKVVLDTNVVVSALLKESGLETAILDLALHGNVAMFVSQPILAEYAGVLQRPKLRIARGLSSSSAQTANDMCRS
jgi:putative PIN family toxin of toxin-antitoxin system